VIGGIAEAFSEAVDEGLAPVDVVADALAQNQVKRKGIPVQNWDEHLFSCLLITYERCFLRIFFCEFSLLEPFYLCKMNIPSSFLS
jgi:hypothetical protein